jgi:tetratricopeptide (TPR) repeat protein
LELVEVYEAPETHAGMVQQLLIDSGIPVVRAPGVSGYPTVEPFVRLQVTADRAEEAMDLIRLGPAMPPPPPVDERELGFTAELKGPLLMAPESPKEARRLADEYLIKHPEDINAWSVTATIANIDDGYAAAEAVIRKGLEANPKHPWLLSLLGKFLDDQGRLDEAQLIYDNLISSNPDAPQGYAGLAVVAIRKDLHDDAKRFALQAADRLHPAFQPETGRRTAFVLLEVGEQARALEILQDHVNWFKYGFVALLVAVVLEQDPTQPEDLVDEAFDEARRFWTFEDGDWEDALERTRNYIEKREFFKKFT